MILEIMDYLFKNVQLHYIVTVKCHLREFVTCHKLVCLYGIIYGS